MTPQISLLQLETKSCQEISILFEVCVVHLDLIKQLIQCKVIITQLAKLKVIMNFLQAIFVLMLIVIKFQDYVVQNVWKKKFIITIYQTTIMSWMDTKKDVNQFKSSQVSLFKKIVKECQKIEKHLTDYRNKYQTIDKQIQNIMMNLEQCLIITNNISFQQLDEEQINQIFDFTKQKFDQSNCQQLLQLPLKNIKYSLYNIEMIIQEQLISLKRKYSIQQIDQLKDNQQYLGSSISKDEQYLAYGGSDRWINIFDINEKQFIKKIELDNQITVCSFTQDSSKLFVGMYGGYIYGYDVSDDFNQFFKQQIHSSHINIIITTQNDQLITCSDDRSIIKTDIYSKETIFKLTGHTEWILAIDYNDIDDRIISGSKDKSIKLWNCRNQCTIIDKEQAHNYDIRQIQFINKYQNILSLDLDGKLYKWKIDLIKNDLIRLQQISEQNEILNFFSVNQDRNLLIICNKYVKILNQQGETINTIEHDGKSNQFNSQIILDISKQELQVIFINRNRQDTFGNSLRLRNSYQFIFRIILLNTNALS
ncbi:Ski complex subunit Rec14 [Paramecium bursaria]